MVNSPLIRPYFFWGGTLESQEDLQVTSTKTQNIWLQNLGFRTTGDVTFSICVMSMSKSWQISTSVDVLRRWIRRETAIVEQWSKPTRDSPLNPDWFIGILIMVYYNPYIMGSCIIPYIKQPTRVLNTAQSENTPVEWLIMIPIFSWVVCIPYLQQITRVLVAAQLMPWWFGKCLPRTLPETNILMEELLH